MAAELANKASLRHLDTDRMIEASTGASVADLFAAEGEEAFRSLECAALKEALASKERVVISTGGGIVTHDDARSSKRMPPSSFWMYRYQSPLSESVRTRTSDRCSARTPSFHSPCLIAIDVSSMSAWPI